MYLPYLRGKQYELLALKEISGLLGEQKRVLPIIEPVRPPHSGMDRCIAALRNVGLDFVLVVNPTVGELRSESIAPTVASYVNESEDSENWNLGLLVHENTDVRALLANHRRSFGNGHRLTLIHKGLTESLEELAAETDTMQRRFDVIDEKLRRRYFRDFLTTSEGVTLRDGFVPEERNSGYLGREETVFSDDHLFFEEEGWYGFSDYLTIGQPYSDGGFTPRAVAIHWTYEPRPGSPIMIRHFTSETNGDTANVGGKFLEALTKLAIFLDERDIHTHASEVMRRHLAASTYPGLGIVKKLSIQNHLELVSGILNRR